MRESEGKRRERSESTAVCTSLFSVTLCLPTCIFSIYSNTQIPCFPLTYKYAQISTHEEKNKYTQEHSFTLVSRLQTGRWSVCLHQSGWNRRWTWQHLRVCVCVCVCEWHMDREDSSYGQWCQNAWDNFQIQKLIQTATQSSTSIKLWKILNFSAPTKVF